jgi:hypothetical protein
MKPLTLGAILSPAFADLPGQVMRALAHVALESFDQTLGNRSSAIYKSFLDFRN